MTTIRLTEWGSCRVPNLDIETRQALFEASKVWQHTHHLSHPPFSFGGLDGYTISTRQWVGIVQVAGARVEIYPKLDTKLILSSIPEETVAGSTLRDLLRLLEAATYGNWIETGRADLDETSLTFPDVWALLLGKHLAAEIRRGLISSYMPQCEELGNVRGKVAISRQVGTLFNRLDRISCEWDEWTPDTSFNRLLKCACVEIKKRTSHPVAHGLLSNCIFSLASASDVSPRMALRESERILWTRSNERYRPSFELARRLLRDLSPELEGGNTTSWAFLVNMNAVFEGFCRAALEAHFNCSVEEQINLGTLFRSPNRSHQRADFVWTHGGARWVGDAKWKLLGLTTPHLTDEEEAVKTGSISPADVRQLTVYTLLLQEKENLASVPQGAILYPTLIDSNPRPQRFLTWSGTKLHLWPVRVKGAIDLAKAVLI